MLLYRILNPESEIANPKSTQCLLNLVNELAKRVRVAHRKVGELFAVHFDASPFQAIDEPAIAQPMLACRRIDADDPQPAHIALPGAAMAVCVRQRAHHLLMGDFIVAAAIAAVLFCLS